jgi:hypothetical protein
VRYGLLVTCELSALRYAGHLQYWVRARNMCWHAGHVQLQQWMARQSVQ